MTPPGSSTDFVGYERLEVFTVVRACAHAGRRPCGAQAGRVALLPRGRRPDRRRAAGSTPIRQARRGRRRAFRRRPGDRRPSHRGLIGRRASAPKPWSTPCGAIRRPATTRRRTCSTTPCASCSATRCARPARSCTPRQAALRLQTRRAPTPDELRQVEDLVNRRIVENHPVRGFVTTRDYAAELGALAFFEEKYGETVRVLEIDDFSRELCGGTHISSTSQIGLFKITASPSVGANTRRIEAITSAAAIEHYRALEDARRVWPPSSAAVQRVAAAVRRRLAETDELGEAARAWPRAASAAGARRDPRCGARTVGGATLVAGQVDVRAGPTSFSPWPTRSARGGPTRWSSCWAARRPRRRGGRRERRPRGPGAARQRHPGRHDAGHRRRAAAASRRSPAAAARTSTAWRRARGGRRQGPGAPRRLRCGCSRSTTASRAPVSPSPTRPAASPGR